MDSAYTEQRAAWSLGVIVFGAVIALGVLVYLP